MKNYLLILVVLLMLGCKGNTQKLTSEIIPQNAVVKRLLQIDSIGQAMHRQATANNPNSQVEKQEIWDALDFDFNDQKDKEVRDSAFIVWNYFVKLCNEGKYKDALENYIRPSNEGYFYVHLRTTTAQFYFHEDIIFPMMMRFLPEKQAINGIIEILEFDLANAELVIEFGNQNGRKYTPSHYEYLKNKLAAIYTEAQLWDKALQQIEELKANSKASYGINSYAYATALFNEAFIHYSKGDKKTALKTMGRAKVCYEKAIKSGDIDPYSERLPEALQNAIDKISEWSDGKTPL